MYFILKREFSVQENLAFFLEACKSLGLKGSQLFSPEDLTTSGARTPTTKTWGSGLLNSPVVVARGETVSVMLSLLLCVYTDSRDRIMCVFVWMARIIGLKCSSLALVKFCRHQIRLMRHWLCFSVSVCVHESRWTMTDACCGIFC